MSTLPPLPYDGDWAVNELAYVRDMVEYHTNASQCPTINYPEYMQFSTWCQWPDKLEIFRTTILSRLSLPPPSSIKALILAQVLPPSCLPSLLEPLEKLLPVINPSPDEKDKDKAIYPDAYMHAIAAALVHSAQAEKQDKEDKERDEKWELWCGLYGKSSLGWVGPPEPREPEWGWYGIMWVDGDGWWSAAEVEAVAKT